MTKWQMIKLMLVPLMRTAAGILAAKDADSKGRDDFFAAQIKALADGLESYDGQADDGTKG